LFSICIVDDEQLIRQGLRKLIAWNQYGFNIIGEAENGEEALKQFQWDRVDVLITDIRMPFINGLELAEKVRDINNRIQIIVLSGYDDFAYLQASIRIGICDYLLKPVKTNELIDALERAKNHLNVSGRFPNLSPFDKALQTHLQNCDKPAFMKTLFELKREINKYNILLHILRQILKSILDNLKCIIKKDGLQIPIPGTKLFDQNKDPWEEFEESCQIIFDMHFDSMQSDLIFRVKKYIEENYAGNITLDKLSREFYINPSYLSQLFKNTTGELYSDYLSRVRMARAQELLMNTNMLISDVSEQVGYIDTKYFSKLFKKVTGMLPTQFRNNNN